MDKLGKQCTTARRIRARTRPQRIRRAARVELAQHCGTPTSERNRHAFQPEADPCRTTNPRHLHQRIDCRVRHDSGRGRPIFLKLDGIRGAATDPRHKDEIDITSYAQAFRNSANFGFGGGAGSGRVSCGDITILKNIDRSSPDLIMHVTPAAISVMASSPSAQAVNGRSSTTRCNCAKS